MVINGKKVLVYTIIAVVVLIALVGGATFAYFQANVSATNTLNVSANTASGSYSFVSYADGAIDMELKAEDMVNSTASISNSVAKEENSANLIVNITAPTNNSVTCEFNIQWVWDSTGDNAYTTASIDTVTAGTEKQYSVKVDKWNGTDWTALSLVGSVTEKDLSQYTWPTTGTIAVSLLAADQSVTVDNSTGSTEKSELTTYRITASMYNLDANQTDIKGRQYRAHVTVTEPSCILS